MGMARLWTAKAPPKGWGLGLGGRGLSTAWAAPGWPRWGEASAALRDMLVLPCALGVPLGSLGDACAASCVLRVALWACCWLAVCAVGQRGLEPGISGAGTTPPGLAAGVQAQECNLTVPEPQPQACCMIHCHLPAPCIMPVRLAHSDLPANTGSFPQFPLGPAHRPQQHRALPAQPVLLPHSGTRQCQYDTAQAPLSREP